MKTTTMRFVTLAALASFGLVLAGSLDPPGPPAPTMVTLQQIYDKIGASVAGVPKTGQTSTYAAGDDGEFQSGVAVAPRFTDNGDGTVKDHLTGLTWLKDAGCIGSAVWASALTDANTLASGSCGLSDGSIAGSWRLPSIKELGSLFDYGHASPALPAGHPFTGVVNAFYWSSTTKVDNSSSAWGAYLLSGDFGNITKLSALYVWPVRSGQ